MGKFESQGSRTQMTAGQISAGIVAALMVNVLPPMINVSFRVPSPALR